MQRSVEYFSGALACAMISLCLALMLWGCSTPSLPPGLIVPKMNCQTSGVTIKVKGGKIDPTIGCIEPDPVPGVSEPPPPPPVYLPPVIDSADPSAGVPLPPPPP